MSSVISDLRTAIEQQQLESLIASPTVLEKCKFLHDCIVISHSSNMLLPIAIIFIGAALYTRYPQSITEFLSKLEAFLMNTHHSTLTLELIGQFEQGLHKDSQNVCATHNIIYQPI